MAACEAGAVDGAEVDPSEGTEVGGVAGAVVGATYPRELSELRAMPSPDFVAMVPLATDVSAAPIPGWQFHRAHPVNGPPLRLHLLNQILLI